MSTKVIVSGGFDPVHPGHIKMFQEAASHGDLIVALNSDDWLTRKKGKPFMRFSERVMVLGSIRYVSDVIPFDDRDDTACDAIRTVKLLNPEDTIIFANGGDRNLENIPEAKTCHELDVVMLQGIGGHNKMQSSSSLLSDWTNNCTDRKWGKFKDIHKGGKVRVKQLSIDSHKSISLQYHYERTEHWFIESGNALVQKGKDIVELAPGDYISIDQMELHQISNISKGGEPLRLIEVQIGDILDEEDIVRIT